MTEIVNSRRNPEMPPIATPYPPQPLAVEATDGYSIRGFFWRDPEASHTRSVVIINPATSICCRYYFRFAGFLFENGFDVVTYDYRGIGESRPARLRGFDGCWLDWGSLDFEAVLQQVRRSFPDQPVHVVAHSIGGFVLGLAPSNHLIQRIFTMGAQYAYRRDYAPDKKLRMTAKWHVVMPLLTMLFGYFPGEKVGWLEDTPSGVVRDWVFSRERFEDTWRGRASARYPDKHLLVQRFAAVTAPTLAVSVTDDDFGTVPAIERLLAYFSSSPRTHLEFRRRRSTSRRSGTSAFSTAGSNRNCGNSAGMAEVRADFRKLPGRSDHSRWSSRR